jgi:MEMO1 family protein
MARIPVVAGSFYPSKREELEAVLKKFLVKSKKRRTLGVVVPHAGYEYSGKTAGAVYSTIEPGFETIVLIGPNHNAQGNVSVSSEEWQTPLGIIKPDLDFIKELSKDYTIIEDNASQSMEHSLEVQIPFIQSLFKGVMIVSITINPYNFDIQTCRDVGEVIARAAKKLKRKILIVASSDFTHYGSMYGYEPFKGGNIVEKIKNNDMKVIDSIVELNPEKVIETCEKNKLTVCGYGAIAAMLFAVNKLGAKNAELVDYSTSFEVSKNKDAIVAYAGISIR